MDPTALTAEQAARLLGVKADVVRRHIAEGLPTGPGGTVNLVTYAAQLNRPEYGKHARVWGDVALAGPAEEVPGQWD